MSTQNLDIFVNLFAKGFKQTKNDIDIINSTAKKSVVSFNSMIKGAVGFAAVALSFSKIKQELTESIKLYSNFDDVMLSVSAVTSATKEQLADLTEIAKKMGQETRYSASQSAEGLKLLGMAGFEAEEAIKALPNVLKLAAAGSLEISSAADIATNVLSGFGLETEKLGQVNDVLVKTFTSANVNLVEIGESFKLVGPIAKGVGANFEDLLASIGRLGDAGLKGSIAGTALKGALGALYDPTEDEVKLMGELANRIGQTSLEIKDSEGNFIGFSKIIEQLENAGMKGEEALKLFGERAGPGMAALLNIGSEKLRTLKLDLDIASGTADNISEKMESGVGGSLRSLGSVIETLRLNFISLFDSEVKNSVDSLKDSVNDIISGLDKFNDSTSSLNGAVIVLKDSLLIVKSIFKILSGTVQYSWSILEEGVKILSYFNFLLRGDTASALEVIKDFGQDFISVFRKLNEKGKNEAGKPSIFTGKINKEKEAIGTGIDEITQIYRKGLLDLEQEYNKSLISLEQYHERRKQITISKINSEIDALNKRKESEKDKEKIIKIENTILQKQIELQRLLSQIEIDKNLKIKKMNEEKIQQQQSYLKTNLVKIRASLDLENEEIKSQYNQNIIDFKQYYDERRQIIIDRANAEIALLKSLESTEQDSSKKDMIGANIYAKEQELQKNLLILKNESYENQKRIDEKLLSEQEKVNNLKLAAEKVFQDQVDRIKLFDSDNDLTSGFQKELLDLQDKHIKELKVIQDFNTAKLDLMREQKVNELLITKETEEQKNIIKQQLALQQQEKEKLLSNQQVKIKEFQLNNMAELARGTSDIFTGLYELMGSKNKELFYIAKAAAIAEATINTSAAITKALPNIPLAIATGALGAVQIAKIASQGLAEGGPVLGKSPSSKADDKIIAVTSGEYVHPVDSVKYYGQQIMEGIRTKAIPRELFNSFGNFKLPSKNTNRFAFATGGSITKNSGIENLPQNNPLNVINVLDPSLLSSYLTSSDGERQVLNIIKRNPNIVRG